MLCGLSCRSQTTAVADCPGYSMTPVQMCAVCIVGLQLLTVFCALLLLGGLLAPDVCMPLDTACGTVA